MIYIIKYFCLTIFFRFWEEMYYFLIDQIDDGDDGLFSLFKISFKNDIGLREMEKGGLTFQPCENENKSMISSFSKYLVFN